MCFRFRLRADERRCARPCRRLSAAGGRPRLDLRRRRSQWGPRIMAGRRCRRGGQRRPGARATRCIRRLAGQRLERRAVDLLEQLAAGDAEPRKDTALLSCVAGSPSAASTSSEAGERPAPQPAEQQRSAIRTACSTFALSRGFLGLAGLGWRFSNEPPSQPARWLTSGS